jgi:hypothetical protein
MVDRQVPRKPRLLGGSRGTMRMKFPFREALACLSRANGVAGELHLLKRNCGGISSNMGDLKL